MGRRSSADADRERIVVSADDRSWRLPAGGVVPARLKSGRIVVGVTSPHLISS